MNRFLDALVRRVVGFGLIAALVSIAWLVYLERHAPASGGEPAAESRDGRSQEQQDGTGDAPVALASTPTAGEQQPSTSAGADEGDVLANGADAPLSPNEAEAPQVPPSLPRAVTDSAATAGSELPAGQTDSNPAARSEALWGLNQPVRMEPGVVRPEADAGAGGRAGGDTAALVRVAATGTDAPDPYVLLLRARHAVAEGRDQAAEQDYRALLARLPHHYSAWGELGNVLNRRGDDAAAAAAWTRAAGLLIDAGHPAQALRLLPLVRRHEPVLAGSLQQRLEAIGALPVGD